MEIKLIAHSLIMFRNKYLVIKRSNIKRGEKNYYPSYWDIPGGCVEEHVEYKWIKNLADLDGESIVPYLYDIMK